MQITDLQDLRRFDIPRDHRAVFDAHNSDRSQLITRWRGTIVEKNAEGAVITAWQKSIYHFGGLNREVPILLTMVLDTDSRITSVKIDEESRGSQGRRCDFACLEDLTVSLLGGVEISGMHRKVNKASDVKCLHLFEILAGAASFYETLPPDEGSAYEQELLFITPDNDGLTAHNMHDINGQLDDMVIKLRHRSAPVMNEQDLCAGADAEVRMTHNGEDRDAETVSGDSFELVYASLNRLFSKCQLMEMKRFGQRGRIKFSNYPSMTGLFLLTFSHSSMRGGPGKAYRIERILHYLQTGYHSLPCKGFGG